MGQITDRDVSNALVYFSKASARSYTAMQICMTNCLPHEAINFQTTEMSAEIASS